MSKKRIFLKTGFIFVSFLFLTSSTAFTATPDLAINYDFIRNSGSFNPQGIRGDWTLKVTGPESLIRAEFYLDGVLTSNDTESPFSWRFNTNDYEIGPHEFKIIGYSIDDSGTVTVNENFLSTPDLLAILSRPIGVLVAIGLIGAVIAVPAIMYTRKRWQDMNKHQKKGDKELWSSEEN